MKHFTFLLSMLVVSAAVAQKPIDRGIHKRTTGGVSFLFGKKKAKEAVNTDVVVFEEAYSLNAIAPKTLPFEFESAMLLKEPRNLASLDIVPPSRQKPNDRTSRLLRPLNRRALAPLASLKSERRLFRRAASMLSAPADSGAPTDWASIVALVTGILGFVVPFFWILGTVFGAIGMKRTKDGSLRGRGMAVAGFICGLVYPLLVILLLGVLFAAL
jgi:hypothetical protein